MMGVGYTVVVQICTVLTGWGLHCHLGPLMPEDVNKTDNVL